MARDHASTERRIDRAIHVLGVSFAVIAAALLLRAVIPGDDALSIAAVSVYGFGLVATFGVSALYHSIDHPRWKEEVRRFDHGVIYVMIAGTYTPFAVIGIGGPEGYGLLALVWPAAVAGLVLKLCWPRRFERASLVLYLALGWIGLLAARSIVVALPTPALVLLVVGGLLYTAGVLFHLWERLPYQNALWHALVLVAAGCHFVAVFDTATFR